MARCTTRRDVLRGMAATVVGGSAVGRAFSMAAPRGKPTASGARKPNVVLVMTDDQGYGDLSCHGNDILRTPNIDRLHAQSVRMTSFHVDPTCSPTRAALLTGRYSSRVGVWHTVMGRQLLRRDEVTAADIFRAGGYRTGIFGKWHVGHNYPYRPQDRGFDESIVYRSGAIGQVGDWWGNDYFDDTYWHNGTPRTFKGFCTDIWFDEALKFIRAGKSRPFFAYLPTNTPHTPWNVADKYSKPYRDRGVKKDLADFYGTIANIDENVGRLVRRLDEWGLADNTILIFMTDNGSSGGGYNAGMRSKKGGEYEGGHRVPCFVRWPGGGIGGGRDVPQIAAHVDLLPTLIDLCGLTPPKGVTFDGTSLRPLLTGKGGDGPARTLLVHSQRVDFPQKWRKSCVMTDRWRLINGGELYDIAADPSQKTDVAGKHADVVKQLRAEYERWWADISGRFDEYCEVVLGDAKANCAELNLMDWHGPNGVRTAQSKSDAVREGIAANGFWAVEVARGGTYEVELRRWPAEVDKPITAAIQAGTAIRADKARLKVGDVDETKPIPPGATAVLFHVELPAGKMRLQTWLIDGETAPRGAYYVTVKRTSK